ncbi:MAG: DUF6241 domain-containing protein [Bacillus sp. (in: firmicutes)]|uniref:DUF6241 domain-containing protein n=1 Tax=Sporolactobacillus sp. STSJ-5 TaxID=2965076 RepID=UPI002104B59F|nr:DUF6241 domain-containing protein [Sporolactobacillus sp. STSJ-5]MCQ2009910.1 DUF6241 domain-containing protein [Sporolactobacillus sp. STSJ-5]
MKKETLIITGVSAAAVFTALFFLVFNLPDNDQEKADKQVNEKKEHVTYDHQNAYSESAQEQNATKSELLSPQQLGMTPEEYVKKFPSPETPKEVEKKGLDGIQNPNPFGDENKNRGVVDDSDFQRYLLLMAGNKKKITDDRIEWLLSALAIDKIGLKHKDVYSEILNRWKHEDFSHLGSDKQKVLNL